MNRPEDRDEFWNGAFETDDYSWLDAEDDERVLERDAELMGQNYGDAEPPETDEEYDARDMATIRRAELRWG